MRTGLAALLFLVPQDPRGTPDQVTHYKIATFCARPDQVDGSLASAAKASPLFGARYAAALWEIHRAAARGSGFQSAFNEVTKATGGPKGASEHLRALALSFKKAATCKDCKAPGKIPSPPSLCSLCLCVEAPCTKLG